MIFYLLIMTFVYSLQSLFCRLYTSARNGQGAIQFSVFYAAFAGVCTLAFNGFAYQPSTATLVLGLINAMVLLTYNVAMVKCGNLGSYAFMMVCVLAGAILIPLLYDLVYLKLSFNVLQIAAVVLMIVSFVTMNLDSFKAKKNAKYLLWCLVLFVVNGMYAVIMNLQQTMMQFTQRKEMIITTFLGMGVLTAVFQMLTAHRSFIDGFRMEKKALLPMICSSVAATVAVNMLLNAMQNINVTILSAVNNGGILVISAIFAFTIFREKLEKHTLVGILLATVSIVMLSL